MYPYQTVIFDLDGTLLDTLQDLADSTNYALSVHRMPARTLEEVRTFVGNGVGRLIHLAVPEGTPAEEEAACLADFRAHYLLNMENKTAPYPGVPALLEHLQAAGIRTAVVSNKFDGAVKGLCQNYFGDRLPVAIGESQGVPRPGGAGGGAGGGGVRGRLRRGHRHRPKRRPALHLGELGLPGRRVPVGPRRPADCGQPGGAGGPAPLPRRRFPISPSTEQRPPGLRGARRFSI